MVLTLLFEIFKHSADPINIIKHNRFVSIMITL